MPEEPTETEEAPLLKVGELARICRKSVRALRFYEEIGLLAPATRSAGGFRLYSVEAVERVRWISKLQDMRLSLTEIQTLMEDWSQIATAHQAMKRLHALVTRRLVRTEEEIARLGALKEEMRQSLTYLAKCQRCSEGRPSRCLECDLEQAPTLVDQFHRTGTGEYPALGTDHPGRD